MAVSTSTRLGIVRWSASTDPFTRQQVEDSHAALEDRAALFLQGSIAARPNATAANARGFYLATDQNAPTGVLYYSDGASWSPVNSYGAPPDTLAPGSTSSAGSGTLVARSNHIHPMLPWGDSGDIAQVGTVSSAGDDEMYARSDHVHVLADGAVTPGKIAAGGVSQSGQIANAIIQSYHFADGAIDEAAISTSQRIPIGSVTMYTGTSAPSGWLICDGASYPTASYSGLFGIIGYKYGGSGANFNVPNCLERFPRGATAPGTGSTLGVTGGADTVTIATGNLPAHAHAAGTLVTDSHAGHAHAVNARTGGDSPSHTHGIAITTDTQGLHNHLPAQGSSYTTYGAGSTFSGFEQTFYRAVSASGSTINYAGSSLGAQQFNLYGPGSTGNAGAHAHNVIGNTGQVNNEHTHAINVNSDAAGAHSHTVTGSTGNTGSGTALNVQPKFVTVNFLIKI